MKKLLLKPVIWSGKVVAISYVRKAIRAKRDRIVEWSGRISSWLSRIRLVVAFLERLNDRLKDGELSDDEATRTIKEAKLLATEVTE